VAAWTDIVEIIAPSNARAGDSVGVTVNVKNLGDYTFSIAVTGVFDGTEIPFSPGSAAVDGGATYPFSSSFIMPSKKVTITAYSWYWTGSEWHQDDKRVVNVNLTEEVKPEFANVAITKYERR